jgi:iron complex transport system ATP-binding protein
VHALDRGCAAMVAGRTIFAMLAARDLGFSFGARPVLRGVTLGIDPGTRTAVVGPNGSGKSTLLRLLGGHLRPASGEVLLDGVAVSSMVPARRARRVAIVPQSVALAFPFGVARFVAFGRHALGTRDLQHAVAEALDRVGLAERADDPLGELSQGQQQRASIARALCQLSGMPAGERYLLADEPTASLDPAHTRLIGSVLGDLAREGVGVAAALHDLGAASSFDRVVLLGERGSLIAAGPPERVLADEPLQRAFGVAFERLRNRAGELAALVPAEGPGVRGEADDVDSV